MSNYTEGPWLYCQLGNTEYDIVTPEGDTVIHLNVLENSTQASSLEANTRLIAAAPDLLDALYKALPFVEDALEDKVYRFEHVHETLDAIFNALHKATGD